jgi:hypothetical protein
MSPSENLIPQLTRIQRAALFVGIIALAVCFTQAFADDVHKTQFFQSYLYAVLIWTGLTVGSMGIYLLHNVVGGNWGIPIRRMVEAGARTLPLMFLLLLPMLLLGMQSIFVWARPEAAHDPTIQIKAAYLNVPFFAGRAVFYFLMWSLIIWRLTSLSHEQDRTGDPTIQDRMRKFAAPSLVFFVFSVTFFFFDWILSLEPQYFSTVYGIMFLVGQVLMTFCFCVALLVTIRDKMPFAAFLRVQHFHDLGNLMLCFTMLWAYLNLAQFLITWAGNLPEEIPWYIRRFTGGWGYMGVFIGIFQFCIPFVLLLMRFIKKNPTSLRTVAIYIICVRFVDVFWVVEPAFRQREFVLYWTDFLAPIGVGGIWIAFWLWHLKSWPLVPMRDPRALVHEPVEAEV